MMSEGIEVNSLNVEAKFRDDLRLIKTFVSTLVWKLMTKGRQKAKSLG